MAERYNEIYRQTGMLYSAGSPVVVYAGAVLGDTLTKKTIVHFKFKSVSDTPIRSMTVSVLPVCNADSSYIKPVEYIYTDLSIYRDEYFGEKTAIVLNQPSVASYKICVKEVEFVDGKCWKGDGGYFERLESPRRLDDAYSAELSEQFRIKYGKIDSPCIYQPSKSSDMWYCTCGAFNLQVEEKCHKCRRVQSALLSVDETVLRTETAHRLSNERQYAEEDDIDDRPSGHKKLVFILLPIVLVLSLILATIPGYSRQKKQYEQGTALLESGKYDQAEEIFTALGEYGDCAELVSKEIPYLRAQYIMKCAENGSTDGLVALGMKRSELTENETVSSALYKKAIEMFTPLGDYKDSQAQIIKAQKALADWSDALISGRYEAACTLLEEKRFCEARDEFNALGDYMDSAVMAQECIYEKAMALYSLIEKYSMEGIYCKISTVTDEKSVFYIPTETAAKLGKELLSDVRTACGDDAELIYKEAPEDSGCIPYCDAVAQLFKDLGGYKDSAEKVSDAEEAGDYSAPFFELCASGNLTGALEWLENHDGVIDAQDVWVNMINTCLPFCGLWSLDQGDSYLLPSILGINAPCMNITTTVMLSMDTGVIMHVALGGSEEAVINLLQDVREDGSMRFSVSPDGITSFYLLINEAGKLACSRFSSAPYDSTVRSCLYNRVG